MKKIGLVGGLSWVSSHEYYRLLNTHVSDRLGAHHSARLILNSLDEGEFVRERKADPSERGCRQLVVDAIGELVRCQAEVFALCANGVHRFAPAIRETHGVEIVHIARATAAAVSAMGLERVGLVGVAATMNGTFYRDILAENGIEMMVPDGASREMIDGRIMSELVHGHFLPGTRAQFARSFEELVSNGAEGVIMGCTEIPMLMEADSIDGVPLFDTTAIYCEAIVEAALTS